MADYNEQLKRYIPREHEDDQEMVFPNYATLADKLESSELMTLFRFKPLPDSRPRGLLQGPIVGESSELRRDLAGVSGRCRQPLSS